MTSSDGSSRRLLALSGIAKTYGGVTALSGVDITLDAGEVHAICGENGAGKSTFMKIIAGAEQPDTGRIEVGGEAVQYRSVSDANARGISIVFQELSLFPEFDAVENVFLGREPTKGGFVDRGRMEREAAPLFAMLGLRIDTRVPIARLRMADQQLIEIAKALALDAQVLILDEPNSSLNVEESRRLFKVVRRLRDEGKGIFYISHRLEEVIDLAGRVSVLRNGAKVAELSRDEMTVGRIVGEMLGEKAANVADRIGRAPAGSPIGAASLEFKGVSSAGLTNCSFVAHPGEVIGLAGLEGSGSEEVFDLLFGAKRRTGGEIRFDGKPEPGSVVDAVRAGIALVPADRRTEGLALDASILDNFNAVVTAALGRLGEAPSRAGMTDIAGLQARALNLRHGGFGNAANSLSGGNQQKIVIGKWLATDPRLVLLNDPTRGVDVGAKDEIYSIIDQLAEDGRTVVFTSSELTEFRLVCHRVLLFYNGTIVGELAAAEAGEHEILEAINTGEVGHPPPAKTTEEAIHEPQ